MSFFIVTFYFFSWTFLLYWVHRLVHAVPLLKKIHWHHHKFAIQNKLKWHWSNLFLFNDDYTSTLDLWITEVIPTMLFSYITGQWWIFIFYYIWAAFFQENLEHSQIDYYPFTSGKWHMVHHKTANKNFGLFFPVWDKIFKTERT
jgi:sterol desaturase/sphingolipid hydroxylase (fatty acid hydroxylase superfamily)